MAKESIKISTSGQPEVFSFIRRNSPKGAGPYNIGTGAGFEAGDWAINHLSSDIEFGFRNGTTYGGAIPSKKIESGHWIFYSERTIRSSKKSKNWDRYVNQECGGMVTSANGTAKVYLYKSKIGYGSRSCGDRPEMAGKKWLIGKGRYTQNDPITEATKEGGILGIKRIDTTRTRNGKKTNDVDYVMRLLDENGDHILYEMKLKKGFFAPTEKQSNKWGILGELTTPFGVLAGNLDVVDVI